MTSREALNYFWMTSSYNDTSANAYETIERDLDRLEAQNKIISECIDLLQISGQHTKQIVLEKLLKVRDNDK